VNLELARTAYDTTIVQVARQEDYFDVVLQHIPKPRLVRKWIFRTVDDRIRFYCQSSDATLPVALNRLAIEIVGSEPMDGRLPHDLAHLILVELARRLPLRYAMASLREEEPTSSPASLEEALPGLYWLNYFGAPYLELIGKSRLLTASAEVMEVGEGVLLALDRSPSSWQEEAYMRKKAEVMQHLGQVYFFDPAHPDGKTAAPVFRP
jgi:hypothetical protein